MSNEKTIKDTLATFRLVSIVDDLLDGQHYRPISMSTAEVLLLHTRNSVLCHVQFPSDMDVDLYGRFIDKPVLWELNAWRTSSERVLKARLYSQKQRETRHILDANILLVARRICRMTSINFDPCKLIARRWILDNDPRIGAVGVTKLYTTIDELP